MLGDTSSIVCIYCSLYCCTVLSATLDDIEEYVCSVVVLSTVGARNCVVLCGPCSNECFVTVFTWASNECAFGSWACSVCITSLILNTVTEYKC